MYTHRIEDFPTEILILIFQKLYSAKEAARCSQVCRRYRDILSDPSHDVAIYGPNGLSKYTSKLYTPLSSGDLWKDATVRATVTDAALRQHWSIEYEDVEQNIESAINCWREYEQEGVEAVCYDGATVPEARWPSSSDKVYAYSFERSTLSVLDLNKGEFGIVESPGYAYRFRSTAREGWVLLELSYLKSSRTLAYPCYVRGQISYTQLFDDDRLGYVVSIQEGEGVASIGVSAPNESVQYVWTGGENILGAKLLFNCRYIVIVHYSERTLDIIEPAVDSAPIVTRSLRMPGETLGREYIITPREDHESQPGQFVLTGSHFLYLRRSTGTLLSCQLNALIDAKPEDPIDWQTVLQFDDEFANLDWTIDNKNYTKNVIILTGRVRREFRSSIDDYESWVACVIPLNRVAKPIIYCQLRDSAAWIIHKSGKVSHVTRYCLDQLNELYRQLDLSGMVPIDSLVS
ncbi:hypothetical protein TRVA0_026S02036 [Trichomonascus vanleenenianus]|uniref:F-box protein n=1 Tax=Trichomonascus vanleenenianus TaxID=2268995 RepID=UPI003ECA1BEB